jgi:hypothetical protein
MYYEGPLIGSPVSSGIRTSCGLNVAQAARRRSIPIAKGVVFRAANVEPLFDGLRDHARRATINAVKKLSVKPSAVRMILRFMFASFWKIVMRERQDVWDLGFELAEALAKFVCRG